MTLDSFFTMTEMNNGLSAPSQVRELLAVMEREKNCVAKNAADSMRHWSAVASAIVATENKDCLDLFVQLDGLDYIAKWLKDALKFDDYKICSIVEESIIHLLLALENFGVNHEDLLSSGIWVTVQNLQVHNNPKVQDKAGALFESWKQKNITAFIPDVVEVGAKTVDKPEIADIERGMGHSESPPGDGPICREISVGPLGHESDNPDLSASSNSSKLVESDDKVKGNTPGLHVSENNVENTTFGKKSIDRVPDRTVKKSDVEINYGIVDPLEVARQVAMEVEREVVEYREPSCCSFKKLPECNVRQPNSPESVSKKQSNSSECSPKEVVNDPNSSNESAPMHEESATSSRHQDAEQTNVARDMATSQLTEVAQEDSNENKALSKFDLNQEICSEDPDLFGNQFFAPVSFVSVSRAEAAAPGLSGAPFQFEGNLGWKGSAVTSAFHLASPCRLQESNTDHSTGGSSSSSKQRQGFLDIDLNVAESIDRRLGDMTADEHIQFYPRVPSGESSAETSSRRSEYLALDLNHSSEDVGTLLDWRTGQFFPQGYQHHGQPLSLMSSNQPARSIDLNDQLAFVKDPSVTSSSRVSKTLNIFGGIEADNSTISILGKRVEVNRKGLGSQTPQLANGRTPEPSLDINLGRTVNLLGIGSVPSSAYSPGYGYTNIAPAPPMPFPSTMYVSGGPIPYMVDSRGQPVFPQILGSASTLPTAYTQPPFVMNLNTSVLSNGVGMSSRSSFDLNSGMSLESGSKDTAGFELLLNSAHARSVDEQLRPNTQLTMNSVFCGKRREPENGWEHDPFRHYTPPWKQS